MFKNRALQLSVIKTNNNTIDSDESTTMFAALDPEKINTLVKDQVKHIAIAVVAVMAAATVLNTVSEIAIHSANRTK